MPSAFVGLGQRSGFAQDAADGTGTFIEFDVMESATREVSARVTQFPTERGSTISDHVIDVPDQLTLSINHSDFALRSPDRSAQEMYDLLYATLKRHALVSVRLPSGFVVGHVITGLSRTEQADSFGAAVIEMTLEQVRIIDSGVPDVPVPDPVRDAALRGKGSKNLGDKTTSDADKATEEQATTILLDGAEAAFGAVGVPIR